MFRASRIATADFPNIWGIDSCDGADSTNLAGVSVIPPGPGCPFSNIFLKSATLSDRSCCFTASSCASPAARLIAPSAGTSLVLGGGTEEALALRAGV